MSGRGGGRGPTGIRVQLCSRSMARNFTVFSSPRPLLR
ncbi:hypothetical protein CSUI_007724, partial [Cystoisospora suis]